MESINIGWALRKKIVEMLQGPFIITKLIILNNWFLAQSKIKKYFQNSAPSFGLFLENNPHNS